MAWQVFCRGGLLIIEADGVARAECMGCKQSAGQHPCPHCMVSRTQLSDPRFDVYANKRSTATVAAAQQALRNPDLNNAQREKLSRMLGVVIPCDDKPHPLFQLHIELPAQVPIDGFHQQAEV